MGERLRLSVIWDRTVPCLRNEASLLVPVAAAFFFLPSVLLTRLMPTSAGAMGGAMFNLSMLPPLLLLFLLQTLGQLTIFVLVLNRSRPTVREALGIAIRRLLPAVGAQFLVFAIICGLLVVAQILAAMVGGVSMLRGQGASEEGLMRLAATGLAIAGPAILYVLARASVVFPTLIATPATPFEALQRSRGLTKGNGWRIAGLILIAAALYLFVQLALGAAFGAIFMLIGRLLGMESVGGLFALLLSGALGAIATLILTVALAFLYSELSGEGIKGR